MRPHDTQRQRKPPWEIDIPVAVPYMAAYAEPLSASERDGLPVLWAAQDYALAKELAEAEDVILIDPPTDVPSQKAFDPSSERNRIHRDYPRDLDAEAYGTAGHHVQPRKHATLCQTTLTIYSSIAFTGAFRRTPVDESALEYIGAGGHWTEGT
ncbi:hypothetical protein LTR48_002368 [Friedmanniomyces endolithicus]|nr:hypothetical protein LTR48_002368 [Friedmanniomyces endolithicus]